MKKIDTIITCPECGVKMDCEPIKELILQEITKFIERVDKE